MDSIRRFFTLEEDSFASDPPDSASLEPPPKETSAPPRPSSRGTLISLPTPRKEEIVVLEPSSFTDAREIAETLKLKKSILLNMRKTDKELARRIVDFLSGISYAIDGHSQKVADQIYLFTPGHIEILIPNAEGMGQGAGQKDDVIPAVDAI
ncbi:MAG: cell division protein SepF [Armatimonadetes bacterium]|nr:cell division protein SepF [Armatimonadota bacterium]